MTRRITTCLLAACVAVGFGACSDSTPRLSQLVYTTGSSAWLGSLEGPEVERLAFTVPPVREPSVSWSADGRRIVVGGRDGFVVFDLVTAAVSPSAWPGGTAGSDVIWPRFGPDGRVYYSSSDGQGEWDLRHMGPDGASPAVLIPSDRFPNNDFFPDWSPDGSRFAFTADWEERNRFLLRISNPAATSISTVPVEGVTHVWSPDGTMIAYQELGVVGVVSPDGETHRSWDPGWSKGVTWSPAGDRLIGISDGVISTLDVLTGDTVMYEKFGSDVEAVAWRPR